MSILTVARGHQRSFSELTPLLEDRRPALRRGLLEGDCPTDLELPAPKALQRRDRRGIPTVRASAEKSPWEANRGSSTDTTPLSPDRGLP